MSAFLLLTFFAVYGLATFTITLCLCRLDGPYNLFGRLRTRAGVRYDEYSNPYGVTEFGRMLACHKCTSLWVGLVLVLRWWGYFAAVDMLVIALAYSAISIVIQSVLDSRG